MSEGETEPAQVGHEQRALAQFTRDAEGFAGAAIMNDEAALDELVRLAGVAVGSRVLDVACGPGIVAVHLARTGASVTGVDLTPAMLKLAAQRSRAADVEVRLVEGSMYDLPFEAGEFDVVVSRYALHHAHDVDLAGAEISRVAGAPGRLVIVDLAADPDPEVAAAYDRAELLRDPSHARNLGAAEQRQLFERLGWQLVESSAYRLTSSVTALLSRSSGPDHDGFRRAFELSLDGHRLGVGARRQGDDIVFDYPIVAQAFVRPA